MSEERPQYTVEVFSRFSSSGRPWQLCPEIQHATACSVRENHPVSNPFQRARGENIHIIYPVASNSSTGSNRSTDEEASTPISRFASTLLLKFQKRENTGQRNRFSEKFRAFVIDRLPNNKKAAEWEDSLRDIDSDFEQIEIEDDYVVIGSDDKDCESFKGCDSDSFVRADVPPTQLRPMIGFTMEIPASQVTKGELIGQGAFGHVYRAWYKGQRVVMKEVASYHYTTPGGKRFIDSLRAELHLMSVLGPHPNVVQCYGGSLQEPDVFILCQLMEMNLADLLYGVHEGRGLPIKLALEITLDVCRGLEHLHFNGRHRIVHRDVKPENILLDKSLKACVADFGLSRTKSHTYILTENAHAGTPEYLAPEAAYGRLDEKMDVYSVGVVLWECIMGKRPWQGCDPFQIFFTVSNGTRLSLPEDVFPEFEEEGKFDIMYHVRKLIERCFISSPKRRPSCKEVAEDISRILELHHYHKQSTDASRACL